MLCQQIAAGIPREHSPTIAHKFSVRFEFPTHLETIWKSLQKVLLGSPSGCAYLSHETIKNDVDAKGGPVGAPIDHRLRSKQQDNTYMLSVSPFALGVGQDEGVGIGCASSQVVERMNKIAGQPLALSVDTWGRLRIFTTVWKYLKSMIHGMFQQGGEITENAATINRNDVWLRARNQRKCTLREWQSTPRGLRSEK